MKKITLLIVLTFLSTTINAQLTDGTYTQEIDERIKHLDKTPITSGILIDRVAPFARLSTFNQGIQKDTSSYTHFREAWDELYRASYSKNFKSLSEFKNTLTSKNDASNVVPIGIINTQFNEFDFGTTQANAKVTYNENTGYFYNIAGKIPFQLKQATVIASLKNKVIGSNVTFKPDIDFTLYKKGKRIKILQLQTNGNTFTLINNYNLINNTFTTMYNSIGKKTLKFLITFEDNTTKTTYATLTVASPPLLAKRSDKVSDLIDILAHSDLAYQGYDESQPILGKNEYRIYYSDESKVIDKPIFILDGFDPLDKRKIDPQSPDYDKEDKSIKELMSYDDDNDNDTPKKDLIEELNLQGYDIIIINHIVNDDNGIDAGSDYIQRNAYTFISLLREINSIKVGNEENIVIGPSMGGLISRYALAYMEKKLAETGDKAKWDHETRLWVSFDSPHQGANIPIGVQKGIQYFANELEVDPAKNFIKNQLNKPAPKQMLVNHYTNNTEEIVGAAGFRDRFQNELDQLGMPKNLRKIALINGSVTSKLNGVSQERYLNIDDNLTSLSLIPGATILLNTFYDKFVADFYHSSNKNSGYSSKVFEAGIRGKFLGWTWWTSRETVRSKPNSRGSYDIAPGGYFDAQRLLANSTDNPNPDLTWYLGALSLHSLKSNLHDPTHSFIPTKSALAFNGNEQLDEGINLRNLICTGETPFDSYFAPKNNEEHITLTAENVRWLVKEINGNQQPISGNISFSGITINGNNALCNGETTSYTINNCNDNIVNWTTSSNLEIVNSNNNQVTVRRTNTNEKQAWVEVSFPNGKKGVKKIAGKPFIDIITVPSSGGSLDVFLRGENNTKNQDIHNIQWVKTGGNGEIINKNSSTTSAFGIGHNWYVNGYVIATNSCGTTRKDFTIRPISKPCKDDIVLEPSGRNQFRMISPCLKKLIKTKPVQLTTLNGFIKMIPNQNGIINLNDKATKGTIGVLKIKSAKNNKPKMVIIR